MSLVSFPESGSSPLMSSLECHKTGDLAGLWVSNLKIQTLRASTELV